MTLENEARHMLAVLGRKKTLITPTLFSRPLPPPSPGEEGERQDRFDRVPLSR